jgi:cytochrome c5
MNRVRKVAGILAISAAVSSLAAQPSGQDLHRLWDSRCNDCHGHSGDFARRFLTISNGELQGRHPIHDLRRFLANHYVPDNEVDAVYRMLLAQADTPPRYREQCQRCHDAAADLVRDTLIFRDGVLRGRESGQPIHDLLAGHKKVSADDVEFFASLLIRVATEVYRP